MMNILEFAESVGLQLWPVQRVVLKLLYGLNLTDDPIRTLGVSVRDGVCSVYTVEKSERDYVKWLRMQGRLNDVVGNPKGLYLVSGRRTGKFVLAALIMAYEGYVSTRTDKEAEWNMSPNQVVSHLLVGPTADDSAPVFKMMREFIQDAPATSDRISNCTQSFITLFSDKDLESADVSTPSSRFQSKFSVKLSVRSAVAKGLRGGANRLVVLDEYANFSRAGAMDVYHATTPSLAAMKGKLIVTGTPNRGGNAAFPFLFKKAKLRQDEVAVQIPTWEMNPNITEEHVQAWFKERTLPDFLQEYGAEFLEAKTVYVPDGYTVLADGVCEIPGPRMA